MRELKFRRVWLRVVSACLVLALAIGHFSTDLNLSGLPIGESGEEGSLTLGSSGIMPLGMSLARLGITVENFAELQAEITAAAPGVLSEIILLGDIELPNNTSVVINGGRHISLTGNSRIIGGVGPSFPTLDVDGSTLHIGHGVVVTRRADSIGRGVIADNGSNIILESGGEISRNNADEHIRRYGGGVYITGYSSFTMHPGAFIRDNGLNTPGGTGTPEGGGVFIDYGSSFNMLGGTISGNVATHGGGVYSNGGIFDMQNGDIIDNIAAQGGGVFNNLDGVFEMHQGRISGNFASHDGDYGVVTGGGGVQNLSVFTMHGGEISSNLTYSHGGGIGNVYGDFTMNDGVISGNTANWGGGLSNYRGYVTMHSGRFEGNLGRHDGGGIHIQSPSSQAGPAGRVELISGTFINNRAVNDGGAVWVQWLPHPGNLATLYVRADVDFIGNLARAAYSRDPAFDAIYAVQISPDITWTIPLTQGYNNFDISHSSQDPVETVYPITYRWVWDYFEVVNGVRQYQDIRRFSDNSLIIPGNIANFPHEYDRSDFITDDTGQPQDIPLPNPVMMLDGAAIQELYFRGFVAYFDDMTSAEVPLTQGIPGMVGNESTKGDIRIFARFTLNPDTDLPWVDLPGPPTDPRPIPPISTVPPVSPPTDIIIGGDRDRQPPGINWPALSQPEPQASPEETEDIADNTPPNTNFSPPTGR